MVSFGQFMLLLNGLRAAPTNGIASFDLVSGIRGCSAKAAFTSDLASFLMFFFTCGVSLVKACEVN